MTVARIERVPLRQVWAHEALDFTTWLEQNIEVLNDALGVTLTDVRREQKAGDFRPDLVAKGGPIGKVVIENQPERSDHDHLTDRRLASRSASHTDRRAERGCSGRSQGEAGDGGARPSALHLLDSVAG